MFASKFKWQFFAVSQASNFLLHGSLGFMDDMLDYRFRFVIRRSFLPIVHSIQEFGGEHFPVAGPALAALIGAAYGRLQSRWDLVTRRREEMAKAESGGDLTSQEIYLEDLTCLLTREVILFIQRALFAGPTLGSSQQQQTVNVEDSIDNGTADEEDGPEDVAMENGASHSQKSRALTDLGEFLLDPKVSYCLRFF